MSEYWKSTPKYWCKHCKTFVRDTKLERTNHDATPKHQGNLKRFLRDLHRGHEKDEKDKERAKAEVARLNGMATGGGSGLVASPSSSNFGRRVAPSLPKPHTTPAQRKQQLAQLAELGVAIPDEFRPDMAMPGEWQVTSETIIESNGEQKPEAMTSGVRKRVPVEEEAEESDTKKRRWGSTYRSHPTEEDDVDLDALISNATQKGKAPAIKVEVKSEPKEGGREVVRSESQIKGFTPNDPPSGEDQKHVIETEPLDRETAMFAADVRGQVGLKREGETSVCEGIVFKKRKTKNIRQK